MKLPDAHGATRLFPDFWTLSEVLLSQLRFFIGRSSPGLKQLAICKEGKLAIGFGPAEECFISAGGVDAVARERFVDDALKKRCQEPEIPAGL